MLRLRLASSAAALIWLAGSGFLNPVQALPGLPKVTAAGTRPDLATAGEKGKASEEYKVGLAAYNAGLYRDAASAFERSYKVVASPNSHMMWGRALRQAGEYDQAFEELSLAQREASRLAIQFPKYAATAESTEAEIDELRPKVAGLAVQIKNGEVLEIWVNRRKVRRPLWPAIAVPEGQVHVVARLTGGRRAWRSIQAQRGSVQRVELDLAREQDEGPDAIVPWLHPKADEPATASGATTADPGGGTADPGAGDKPGAESKHDLRLYSYIAGGVGGLGLVTWAVFGSMSKSTFSDLEARCPQNSCPPEEQDNIDKGQQQQTIANVGLVVGLVGLAAGGTLFALDLSKDEKKAGRGTQLLAGPGQLFLKGRF